MAIIELLSISSATDTWNLLAHLIKTAQDIGKLIEMCYNDFDQVYEGLKKSIDDMIKKIEGDGANSTLIALNDTSKKVASQAYFYGYIGGNITFEIVLGMVTAGAGNIATKVLKTFKAGRTLVKYALKTKRFKDKLVRRALKPVKAVGKATSKRVTKVSDAVSKVARNLDDAAFNGAGQYLNTQVKNLKEITARKAKVFADGVTEAKEALFQKMMHQFAQLHKRFKGKLDEVEIRKLDEIIDGDDDVFKGAMKCGELCGGTSFRAICKAMRELIEKSAANRFGPEITDDILKISNGFTDIKQLENLIDAFEKFKGIGNLSKNVKIRIKEVSGKMKNMTHQERRDFVADLTITTNKQSLGSNLKEMNGSIADSWQFLDRSKGTRRDFFKLQSVSNIRETKNWHKAGLTEKQLKDGINSSKTKEKMIERLDGASKESSTPEEFLDEFKVAGRNFDHDFPDGFKIDNLPEPSIPINNKTDLVDQPFKNREKAVTKQEKIEASELLAEARVDQIYSSPEMKKAGWKRLDVEGEPPGKQGKFDRVYVQEVNGKIENLHVIEAKGGGSQLGGRQIRNGKVAKQGTPQYRDDIIENLKDKLSDTPDTNDLRGALIKAQDKEKISYIYVQQSANDISKFKIKVLPE